MNKILTLAGTSFAILLCHLLLMAGIASAESTSYIYANGQRLAKVNESGVFYIHSDNLGSTSAMSDKDGNVVEEQVNLPFGEPVSGDERYGFTGKEHDETGLQYFGARYYNPSTARFWNPDPVKDGVNWFVYANNNPLKYVDPDGREALNIASFDKVTSNEYDKFKRSLKSEYHSPELVRAEKYVSFYFAVNPKLDIPKNDKDKSKVSGRVYHKGTDLSDLSRKKGWNGKGIPTVLDAPLLSIFREGYKDKLSSGLKLHEFIHVALGSTSNEGRTTCVTTALSERKYGKLFNPISVDQMSYLIDHLTKNVITDNNRIMDPWIREFGPIRTDIKMDYAVLVVFLVENKINTADLYDRYATKQDEIPTEINNFLEEMKTIGLVYQGVINQKYAYDEWHENFLKSMESPRFK